MRIDHRLNFVIPLFGPEIAKTDGDGKPVIGPDGRPVMIQPVTAYVHSTPIAAEVAERHFLILAQTFSQIFNQGLGAAAGPGVAMMLMKRIAQRTGEWEGDNGVERSLVEEIRRCTMVAIPGPSGWTAVPLQVAVDRKVIDDEDRREVENAIVFFIAVSATLNRAERKPMLESACGLWSAQLSSLNASAFAASLPRSTGTGSSGETSHAPAPQRAPGATATPDGRRLSVPH
jgi:hypothetical protein